jgi:hypothetical protein
LSPDLFDVLPAAADVSRGRFVNRRARLTSDDVGLGGSADADRLGKSEFDRGKTAARFEKRPERNSLRTFR